MKFFKFNIFNLISTLSVLLVFVISGAIFLTLLGFVLYGLSRLLIFWHLGYFGYNKGFYQNLFYYGSYIVLGYFTMFLVEYLMDYFKKKLPQSPYFHGEIFHLISYSVTTLMFYFVIHIHYTSINIDFWVIMLIMAFFYVCKEVFYPESENLNRNK